MIVNEKDKISSINSSRPLLIMLPFAGGSSYSYKNIIKPLQHDFDILCPELPGRGALLNEPLIKDLHELVEHVFTNWIKPLQLKRPYVLFGHSMGALLGYLLAHSLMKNQLPLPIHLVVSGREEPMYIDEDEPTFSLSSSQFRDKIREYGGLSDTILNDPELMEYFDPILRADFEAVERYRPVPLDPLDIPITVLYGSQEDIAPGSVLLWNQASKRIVRIMQMPGDHFFIFDNAREIVNYLKSLK